MKDKINKRFGFLIGDIFIAVFVLLIAAIMFVSFTINGQNKGGKTAFIYVNGEILYEVPLDKNYNDEIKIGTEMIIEISNGRVRIQYSNCKNQNCVKIGSINTQNQIIACMPNRIYILIKSEADNLINEFDAIIG